jgi:hypothetical protein
MAEEQEVSLILPLLNDNALQVRLDVGTMQYAADVTDVREVIRALKMGLETASNLVCMRNLLECHHVVEHVALVFHSENVIPRCA